MTRLYEVPNPQAGQADHIAAIESANTLLQNRLREVLAENTEADLKWRGLQENWLAKQEADYIEIQLLKQDNARLRNALEDTLTSLPANAPVGLLRLRERISAALDSKP